LKSIKYKDITFYPSNEFSANNIIPPSPSSSSIPLWFKKTPKYSESNSFLFKNGESNLTAKSCMPLIDGFASGYLFLTPFDIQVNRDIDGNAIFEYAFPIPSFMTQFVNYRHEFGQPQNQCPWDYENFQGYDKLEFNWMPYWGVETPKGYSCLFTHPINRLDLPFYTLGGVLDTDGWGAAGNQPFLLKKDWSGTIPFGTPFLQVIPFKRDNWKSIINKEMINKQTEKMLMRGRFLRDYYKKHLWESKTYR